MSATLSTTVAIANIDRLIALIDDRVKAAGVAGSSASLEEWQAHLAKLRTIIDDLVEEEGARYRASCHGYVLKLAGIQTSCTGGDYGLLTNWKTRALKRREALMAEPKP